MTCFGITPYIKCIRRAIEIYTLMQPTPMIARLRLDNTSRR